MASRSNKTQTGKLFGISTPILNLIDYEIDQQESNIDFENINLLIKALSGIYITSVKQRIDVLLEDLSTYVMKNTSTLTKSVNNFDMRDWLQKVVSDDEVNFTPSALNNNSNDNKRLEIILEVITIRVKVRSVVDTDKQVNLKELKPADKIIAGFVSQWHQTKFYKT